MSAALSTSKSSPTASPPSAAAVAVGAAAAGDAPTADAAGRGLLTPRNAEIRATFDAIAPRYDLANRVLSCGVDVYWRKVAVATFRDLPRDGRVLDLACGTCDLAIELRRRRPDARLVGVDLSRAMLARGRSKIGAAGFTLVNAPAEALPFADLTFDGAMIGFGIRNVPDFRAGLREMRRVLRPGGRIVVLEFSTPPSRSLWRLYNWYFYNVLPRVGGWLTGREHAYRYLTDTVTGFPGAADFAAALRDCGFDAVTWRALTGGIACVHTGVRDGDTVVDRGRGGDTAAGRGPGGGEMRHE
jgi:demethylmenaquinone methyltransferase/2-methoxy-6-polyprenyl-1,4-benzoquinol methylase